MSRPIRIVLALIQIGSKKSIQFAMHMFIVIRCPQGVVEAVSYCIQHLFLLMMSVELKRPFARTKCYLVEESLWELLETLGAHKALLVVQLPVAVHDLLSRGKATLAALTHGVGQSVGHVAEKNRNAIIRIRIHWHSPNTHRHYK